MSEASKRGESAVEDLGCEGSDDFVSKAADMTDSSAATSGNARGKSSLLAVASIGLWLVAWQLASVLLAQPLLLPGPIEVACSLAGLLGSALFWSKTCFSAVRVLGGMLLAYACALMLAGLSRGNAFVKAFIRVPLVVMKSTPVVCVVVLLLLWLGSANVGIAAVFLMALPAVYFPMLEALDAPDDGVAEALRVNGVSGLRFVLAHTWPRLLPFLVGASESVVGMSWKAGIAAELIGVPAGSIGERIYQAKLLLETGELLAWTIVVIVLAALCERLFVALLRASGTASVRVSLGLRRRAAAARAAKCGGVIALRDAVLAHGAAGGRTLSLEAAPGARLCLMAPSGAGKTTLLRTLAGLEQVAGGEVARPGRVSMAFQEIRLIGGLSAAKNVLLCAAPGRDAKTVREMLSRVLPGVDLDAPVAELSGGQRRRVELVRALAADGEAVLLDEPFSGLDSQSRELACALIEHELGGRSLVIASHDEADATRLGASIFRLG